MNDEELNIYTNVLNISGLIYNKYKRLLYLEYNGKNNTLEYNRVLKTIEILNNIEDYYYKKVENNFPSVVNLCTLATSSLNRLSNEEKLISDPAYLIFNDILDEDIIYMRIVSKASNMVLDNNEYRIDENRNKYFLMILDDQINDKEFIKSKKFLLKTKYQFAFINSNSKENVNNAQNEESVFLDTSSEIMNYVNKIISLNKKSILSPLNYKKLLLSIDYIRANMLNMKEEDIGVLKGIVGLNSLMIPTSTEEGIEFANNIIDMYYEDKNHFKDGLEYKRKF